MEMPMEEVTPTMEHQHNTMDHSIERKIEQSKPINATTISDIEQEGTMETIVDKRKRENSDDEKVMVNDTKTDESSDPNKKQSLWWKTSLCSYFRSNNGVCSHGDTCRYAHGEEELRQRPDKSWDPTSSRAKKIQKMTKKEMQSVLDSTSKSTSNSGLDKCLIGFPRNWGTDQLKKFLDDQGIKYQSAKKRKKMSVSFVVFECVEQVNDAIEILNEKSASGKQIKITDATPRFMKSSDTSEDIGGDNAETTALNDNCTEESIPKTKSVRDVATPLAHMAYEVQLEQKRNSLVQTLRKLPKNARKACPDSVSLPEWILNARDIGGLPCELEGILESPIIDGYRNKCEFSVGYSVQGKPTVGFKPGNFIEGVTAVEEPDNCPNISKISCKYAHIFQDFLQSSEFPIWNQHKNAGFWRQLTVREGRAPHQASVHENAEAQIAEVMIMVQVCSLNVEEQQMKNEFSRMAQAFTDGATSCNPSLPLTVLVVQDHTGISNSAPADSPLIQLAIPNVERGSSPGKSSAMESRIHDYISNLRFSISPTAFFQVNTLAAERMYALAGDWAKLSQDTLLFDICCGTGTIGLTLAHRVGMVVGIEMNESAISDANKNAEINGIKNCKFVCGKAENVIEKVLKEYLDVPEQHNDASNDMDTIANGNSSTRNSNTENCNNDGLEGEHMNCIINGTDNLNSLTRCTTECVHITQKGNESKAESPIFMSRANSDCKNDESQNKCQENSAFENTGPNNNHACHFKDVVAIVDPPRIGLHTIVIKALRTNPRIRRLVYISCNPESLVANAIELCTPSPEKMEKSKGNKQWRSMSLAGLARHRTKSMPISEPFRPVKAMGVDLFPHTSHCEMVMLFER